MDATATILPRETPNYELLRRHGWYLSTISGEYCVAWHGRDEGIFHWNNGEWEWLGGRCEHEGIQTRLAS